MPLDNQILHWLAEIMLLTYGWEIIFIFHLPALIHSSIFVVAVSAFSAAVLCHVCVAAIDKLITRCALIQFNLLHPPLHPLHSLHTPCSLLQGCFVGEGRGSVSVLL